MINLSCFSSIKFLKTSNIPLYLRSNVINSQSSYSSSTRFYSNVTNMVSTNKVPFSVGLDPFCHKQFEDKAVNHIPCEKETFMNKVQEILDSGDYKLTDGYAPFCKHIFVKNFTKALCGSIEITEKNEHLLKSGYVARTSNELPVLSRWFRRSDVEQYTEEALYLDLILYSKEQVIKENEATNTKIPDRSYDKDYYIISVKPQNIDKELPMLPITMMRNTMIEEGGSGVGINRGKYLESVEFWSKRAAILN